jgi:hypothetical protein
MAACCGSRTTGIARPVAAAGLTRRRKIHWSGCPACPAIIVASGRAGCGWTVGGRRGTRCRGRRAPPRLSVLFVMEVHTLDLSSPIIEDRDIAGMLYGRTVATMLDPSTPVITTRDKAEGI